MDHSIDKTPTKTTRFLLPILSVLTFAPTALSADRLEYNRDIRPILAENCFACHGQDSRARKADLRLDQREAALKAGVMVPGQPEKSRLAARIFSADAKETMPPPHTNKKLTAAQKELLKRWLAEGAEYQPHWSFLAPKRPALPVVKKTDWPRNPIDRFILAELEKHGLEPAPEADRRTLARRLSLDLVGLPPEPAEVEAFVSDASADAYEKYVDHLMQSPHWGEHRGRYWLDAARYADTHGIHFDNFREIWPYRDWVIGAFNRNVPFDRFTIEQLAGDLLPNRTIDQQIASGFNRCNITSNEGGLIAEEYLVLYTRDRTETVSQVWLGLTANCAVCHDHKFDPITAKDFYSMAAFFNNNTQAAMDGNVKDTPPTILVPRMEDRSRWEAVAWEITEQRAKAESRRKAARPEFDRWLAATKAEPAAAAIPTEGLRFHAPLSEGAGKTFNFVVDGKARQVSLDSGFKWEEGKAAPMAFSLKPGATIELADVGDLEGNQGFSYGAWIKLPRVDQFGAVFARMDNANGYRGWDLWCEGGKIGAHIINRWPENALKAVTKTPLKANEWQHVFIVYDGSNRVAGLKVYVNGVVQQTEVQADSLKDTIRTAVPLKIGQRNTSERLGQVLVQDVRIYGRALTAAEVGQLAGYDRLKTLLAKAPEARTAPEVTEIYEWWIATQDQPYKDTKTRLDALQREEAALRSRGAVAHVMQERNGEPMAYILYRGDYDKRRDPVKAATPAALPPMPDTLPRNRLGFAQWLLRPEHPLTARVTVNRFWQELFGTGIVRTSGDFGSTGEPPSHPELLDWLAVDFREDGWDVKRFFKQMVMSATYRQAALSTPEKRDRDPQNRLLSRGPRFRMDAEMIRDQALAASGILVPRLGGPSVRPYQPEGVWEAVAMIGSDTRDYRRDRGENLYRRSMYTFWKRAAPPASMDILNAPNRETCAVRRERTNTPLQALVTLNDVQFVEAARFLAQRALQQGGDSSESRIDFIARRLLARPFRAEEMKVVRDSLDDLLVRYRTTPQEAKKLIAVGESKADPALDPPTLAAWTMLVNELMNLDEMLNK
jgi:hypothetical protein